MTILANNPTFSPEIANSVEVKVQRLIHLAARGLAPMFDPTSLLFCFRMSECGTGLVREGQSTRYTVITLLGLHRFQQSGGQSPIQIEPVINRLLEKTNWIDNVGDLGLLIWLCAHALPGRLPELDRRLGILSPGTFLNQPANTMELAWLLTGLCYWRAASPQSIPGLDERIWNIYKQLKDHQGPQGIFRHTPRNGGLTARTRGWIGTFADQVYPIYAMSLLSAIFGETEPEARALYCAQAICEAQGDRGQWWWHYDSSTGQVIDGYPVFSVHQHAMAPMALLPLGDRTGRSFASAIDRGLQWINSNNELHYEMENSYRGVIWRCVYRAHRSPGKYLRARFHSYASKVEHKRPQDLKVLFECRPYELGWLLYAFANRPSGQCLVPSTRP